MKKDKSLRLEVESENTHGRGKIIDKWKDTVLEVLDVNVKTILPSRGLSQGLFWSQIWMTMAC